MCARDGLDRAVECALELEYISERKRDVRPNAKSSTVYHCNIPIYVPLAATATAHHLSFMFSGLRSACFHIHFDFGFHRVLHWIHLVVNGNSSVPLGIAPARGAQRKELEQNAHLYTHKHTLSSISNSKNRYRSQHTLCMYAICRISVFLQRERASYLFLFSFSRARRTQNSKRIA